MSVQGARQLQARLKAIGDTSKLLKGLQIASVAEAKRLVPRKTGHLGRSIHPGRVSGTEAVVAASANYAVFVEKGTGIYGPRKRKIVPRNASVLAWRTGGPSAVRLSGRARSNGTAGWAFAGSVKGRKATPFLLPGVKKAVEKGGLSDVIVSEWNDAA